MNIGFQIAATGASVFALIWGYGYVCDVAGDLLPRHPHWAAPVLGGLLLVSAAAVPLGVLAGVWL